MMKFSAGNIFVNEAQASKTKWSDCHHIDDTYICEFLIDNRRSKINNEMGK
jgi:hypothetical protein